MPKSHQQQLSDRLDSYRRDYEQVTGKPFRHFHCPIRAIDEPTQLIRGHIVNQAFKNAPRAWVVQRADVGSFYGAHFESSFEALQYRGRLTLTDMLTDQALCRKLKPTILNNNAPVPFTPNAPPLSDKFVCVEVGEGPKAPCFGIKMSRQQLIESARQPWAVSAVLDARVPALVSLIKAAHLTLFHVLGYRCALSAAGLFVGRDILGRFFESNSGRPKAAIQANAWAYFREFAAMFRPILKIHGHRGTLADRKLLVCHGSSGNSWAQIVLVNAGYQMHAVMIPTFDCADAVSTFFNFLSNDNERLQVSIAQHIPDTRQWTIDSDRVEHFWPKSGLLYPDRPAPLDFPEAFNYLTPSQPAGRPVG